jgi:hypothetical protein
MIPYLILGGLLGLPLVLGLLFRVSTSHIFFSLMAGEVLARTFGEDVGSVIHSFIRHEVVLQYAESAVLILPMILTAVFLKATISKGKLVLHFIPLLITGVVLAAFLLPMLPADARAQVASIEAGRQLLDLSTAIVGAVVFIQLISLWLLNRVPGEGHHRKNKKREA